MPANLERIKTMAVELLSLAEAVVSVQRIAIVNQELSAAKETIGLIAKVASDLNHPCFIRINTNASNVNDAGLELNDEEDHVPDGAEGAQCFDTEEVAGVQG